MARYAAAPVSTSPRRTRASRSATIPRRAPSSSSSASSEKQSVIATGSMQGDRFVATEVLAKHDENYIPRDVAEAMGKAHQKHNVPEDTAKPSAY